MIVYLRLVIISFLPEMILLDELNGQKKYIFPFHVVYTFHMAVMNHVKLEVV
jgi:hypothetical protein